MVSMPILYDSDGQRFLTICVARFLAVWAALGCGCGHCAADLQFPAGEPRRNPAALVPHDHPGGRYRQWTVVFPPDRPIDEHLHVRSYWTGGFATEGYSA